MIAIIEDDTNIRKLIKIVLSDLKIEIHDFDNGWKGLDALLANDYDLLILDLMLPGVNGIEICRKIRKQNLNLPILMLTSKSEEDDIVKGLEMGADDYLTKPFSNVELLARARALIRRSKAQSKKLDIDHKIVKIGDLTLNISHKTLLKNKLEINLTSKEFELLQLFMTQPGRNFSRIDVLERVWGEHFEGLEHTVNSNINRLRNKIEDDPSQPKYLVTVWGLGYKFNNHLEI